MGEMVDRVAMWLHQHRAGEDGSLMLPWGEVPDERKALLHTAAKDLILTMRRPTLNMRVHGRIALSKGEGEVWRVMVDNALKAD